MKILSKNTTKYTKENCNNFTEFHSNKFGKKELFKIITGTILFIYLLISNIIYKNWIFLLLVIILGIIAYFLKNKEIDKIRKNKKKQKDYTFYFYEKYIKIKCKRSFERLAYFKIYKIFETNEYFFLYLDEKSSLILSKKGFEVGTPKEFSKFIKRKCPFKYKDEGKK